MIYRDIANYIGKMYYDEKIWLNMFKYENGRIVLILHLSTS